MAKLPAFQFYPGDWRKDAGIQSLDYHTRGVWFEILCFMHESSERGVLLLNNKPVSDKSLANMLGLDNQILTTTLTSLFESGVAHRREDGAIYNKRMILDEKLRQIRTEVGKKGGNPNLVKQNSTTQDNQIPTPSSSSSSSYNTLHFTVEGLSVFENEQCLIAYRQAGLSQSDFARGAQLVNRHWETSPKRKRNSDLYCSWVIQELLKEKTNIERLAKVKDGGGYKPHTGASTYEKNKKFLEEIKQNGTIELDDPFAVHGKTIANQKELDYVEAASGDVVVSLRRNKY